MEWHVFTGPLFGAVVGGCITLCIKIAWLKRFLLRAANEHINSRLDHLERVAKLYKTHGISAGVTNELIRAEVEKLLNVKSATRSIDELERSQRILSISIASSSSEEMNVVKLSEKSVRIVNEDLQTLSEPKLSAKDTSCKGPKLRKFVRYECDRLIDVRFELSKEWYEGYMQDISTNGICVLTSREILVGQRIKIKVDDFDSKELMGVVRWLATPRSAANLFRAGIELEEEFSLPK